MTNSGDTVESTDEALATIGSSKTIHKASAWIRRDNEGGIVSRKVYAVACGSDRRRGGRSVFNSVNPNRYQADCVKCLDH